MTESSASEKIAKLLALSVENGATEAEAINAMAMAQKLALENGLDIDSISASSGMSMQIDNEPVVKEMYNEHKVSAPEAKLVSILTSNFRCFSFGSKFSNGFRHYYYVGKKSDVSALKQVLTFAKLSMMRGWARWFKDFKKNSGQYYATQTQTHGLKNDYFMGFLDGIKQALAENVKTFGLVTTLPKTVEEAMVQMNLKLGQVRNVSMWGNASARNAGASDGMAAIRGSRSNVSSKSTLSCA